MGTGTSLPEVQAEAARRVTHSRDLYHLAETVVLPAARRAHLEAVVFEGAAMVHSVVAAGGGGGGGGGVTLKFTTTSLSAARERLELRVHVLGAEQLERPCIEDVVTGEFMAWRERVYLVRVRSVQRGAIFRAIYVDMMMERGPSWAQFDELCGPEAQERQRAAYWFSASPAFEAYFNRAMVHWVGVIESVNRELVTAVVRHPEHAGWKLRLQKFDCPAGAGIGSTVPFTATLTTQGGRFTAPEALCLRTHAAAAARVHVAASAPPAPGAPLRVDPTGARPPPHVPGAVAASAPCQPAPLDRAPKTMEGAVGAPTLAAVAAGAIVGGVWRWWHGSPGDGDGAAAAGRGGRGSGDIARADAADAAGRNGEAAPSASAVGGECVVCMDAAPSEACIPCGHKCLCSACARSMSGHPCPVCRRRVEMVCKIYE